MYLSEAEAAIREPHVGDPLELSPPHAAVQFAEASADADRAAERDGLNVTNLANDLERHLRETPGVFLGSLSEFGFCEGVFFEGMLALQSLESRRNSTAAWRLMSTRRLNLELNKRIPLGGAGGQAPRHIPAAPRVPTP